ncbi:MAG: hypothetical protein EA423_01905 [Phycisphaerales bacterium]|nr:MAG: hypothetical protein EA423_01905 [Phycisphaerales bacterium]
MADNQPKQQSSGSSGGDPFIKFFVPGLLIGLVVGGLAGAVLPDLIGSPTPTVERGTTPTGAGSAPRDREDFASPDPQQDPERDPEQDPEQDPEDD